MKSLNIVFPEKQKVELREEEIAPLKPDEVLCAAEKSLVSTGTETCCLRGVFDEGTNWQAWVKYPFYPGYSMAGRVLEVGNEIRGIKKGDRIACSVSHRQFFNCQQNALIPIPSGITDETATWAALSATTQMGIRRAEIKFGETAAVIGLGLLGQLIVQYLKVSGVSKIIAIDLSPKRLGMAKAHGASHALAMDAESAQKKVRALTQDKMLDMVFDITGHPGVLASALQLLRRFGRLVLLGDTSTPSQQHLGPGVVSNSISILGIHTSAYPEQATEWSLWGKKEMTALFFELVIQGRMQVDDLTTSRRSPEEAYKVYEKLLVDRGNEVAVIFDWTR